MLASNLVTDREHSRLRPRYPKRLGSRTFLLKFWSSMEVKITSNVISAARGYWRRKRGPGIRVSKHDHAHLHVVSMRMRVHYQADWISAPARWPFSQDFHFRLLRERLYI